MFLPKSRARLVANFFFFSNFSQISFFSQIFLKFLLSQCSREEKNPMKRDQLRNFRRVTLHPVARRVTREHGATRLTWPSRTRPCAAALFRRRTKPSSGPPSTPAPSSRPTATCRSCPASCGTAPCSCRTACRSSSFPLRPPHRRVRPIPTC